MRIPGLGRIRRAIGQVKNRLAPGAVVLLYHRVTEVASDPWRLAVTPRHFAEHLEVLRQQTRLMSLARLAQELRDGKTLGRAAVITFDDGYLDNLENAKPALARFDCPATVFVVSGYMGAGREFWWDELEGLLLQPGALPAMLKLPINGRILRWELGEAAIYSEADFQRHCGWRAVEDDTDPTPRHSLYRALWERIRPLSEKARRRVLDDLAEWAGGRPLCRAAHRPMNRDELVELAGDKLVEIGAHTVSHASLPDQPIGLQYDEVRRSKTELEQIVGQPVVSFAYPYGNYDPETPAVVREAGFSVACTTLEDTVRRHMDLFELPRFEVQDWNGDEFARRLPRWSGF